MCWFLDYELDVNMFSWALGHFDMHFSLISLTVKRPYSVFIKIIGKLIDNTNYKNDR